MATLKRGESEWKGGYRFRFTDSEGKRKAIYAKTIKELRAKEKGLLKTPVPTTEQVSTFKDIPTLAKQIEDYLTIRNTLNGSTMRTYGLWLKQIRNDILLGMRLDQIKSADVKRWIAELNRRGCSQSTINGYYSALVKPALELAVEDELITRNPASFKLTAVSNKSGKSNRSLTEEEMSDFITAIQEEPFWVNAFMVLIETGLRVSELCGLTKEDIDFNNREIHVRRQLKHESGLYSVDELKTDSGRRTIPMSTTAERYLQDAIGKGLCKKTVDGVNGFIFSNKSGNPMDRNNLSKKYSLTAKKLGIDGTCCHSLRHTFCTRMIRKGVNLKSVQYLMGHKNAATTLNIYTHVQEEDLKRIFD